MNCPSLAGLFVAVLLVAASPGPGVFTTVATALAWGFCVGLWMVAGIVTGQLISPSMQRSKYFLEVDNRNGTVADLLTGFVWLKNANCFKMMDWKSAEQAAKGLKDGDGGPDPDLVLSDDSSAGVWRLPTMRELCTLIDYGRRNPTLPNSHEFRLISGGSHWSATRLEYDFEMAWIVHFESGTTCYEDINNHAGYVWPVRKKE